MAPVQVAENYEDQWGLTWYLKWGIMHQLKTESSHIIHQQKHQF